MMMMMMMTSSNLREVVEIDEFAVLRLPYFRKF